MATRTSTSPRPTTSYTGPGRYPDGTVPTPAPYATGDRPSRDYTPTINPDMTWLHPQYGGADPAYAAWLAQAELQGQDAISQAKLRRAQLDEAYRQALTDLDRQGVMGRRSIQNNMLARGVFQSGETDRRQQEYDTQIAQAQGRAKQTLADQVGSVDESQRSALASLSTQAANQVSQAMMRDALAQYQAQQQAASAATAPPAATYTPSAYQAPTPAANFSPTMPANPTYNPVYDSQSLFRAQTAPKPKPPSGTTGQLKLTRSGLQ